MGILICKRNIYIYHYHGCASERRLGSQVLLITWTKDPYSASALRSEPCGQRMRVKVVCSSWSRCSCPRLRPVFLHACVWFAAQKDEHRGWPSLLGRPRTLARRLG